MGSPVLLDGVTGAGKTCLVSELARILNKKDLITIHLGDQTDSKALLGTYVSTSTPGSFRWQEGVLTKAVENGSWVLIEDIDLAPQEVISVIVPLLESRTLFIPNRGERIRAAQGFQMFATRRVATKTVSRDFHIERSIPGGSLWTRVHVDHLSDQELCQVVSTKYPNLSLIASSLVEVFRCMCLLYSNPEKHGLSSIRVGRPITSRDFMKWSVRISTLIGADDAQPISLITKNLELIFQEAVDCFCGMIPNFDEYIKVLHILGSSLSLSESTIDHYINHYSATLDTTNDKLIRLGRVTLDRFEKPNQLINGDSDSRPFVRTKFVTRLLERLGVSVNFKEPILLVGETGTGKTTVVQHLAKMLNTNLIAVNLSQQTDSSELLGGFKPIDSNTLGKMLYSNFTDLFVKTFPQQSSELLNMAHGLCNKRQWLRLIKLIKKTVSKIESSFAVDSPTKMSKTNGADKRDLLGDWMKLSTQVQDLENQIAKSDKALVFQFIKGTLTKAIESGDWLLLDEINLATTETLECLSGLLQDSKGSILLSEKGDTEPIRRHPNFRIFACMNPSTDVGKKDLPPGFRNRFTEFYVPSPDTNQEDLIAIIELYISKLAHGDNSAVMDVVDFYQKAKQLQISRSIADGANQAPHFSIRTLTRALNYVSRVTPIFGLRRSLYEGLSMSFTTQLVPTSQKTMKELLFSTVMKVYDNPQQILNRIPKLASNDMKDNFVQFGSYILPKGPLEINPADTEKYIQTASVKVNLHNLARVVMDGRAPVLIQGPTSAGKTSMIEYLAKKTGHKFVRINNHEHTDLQEYIGSYISKDGKLIFQEGALVEALRNGYWIVLDELNLAPSDVLEALNRLLDDNRELLIAETQQIVKPHPHFMLFATQNPAGLYGGRKTLSRAFRNRFLELHFDELPEDELEIILTNRCSIPPSHCKLLVETYTTLFRIRKTTRIFDGKHSFITLRDLFRWANRHAVDKHELARNGFMILGERVRKPQEKEAILEVLEKVMKTKIDTNLMYNESPQIKEAFEKLQQMNKFNSIAWTNATKRLYSLVYECLKHKEPVLLVGETGCGKTTVCQILSTIFEQDLTILNCHQNTESSDILGSQRPNRNRALSAQARQSIIQAMRLAYPESSDDDWLSLDPSSLADNFLKLSQIPLDSNPLSPHITTGTLTIELLNELKEQCQNYSELFTWHDGPLIQSMKQGGLFLLDEISLAEDSVLERLNSVLEPERTLFLAEKSSETNESLTAVEAFRFLATMNPGGDYGKKELSPALRNRFTEIWVPMVDERSDLEIIISKQLNRLTESDATEYSNRILDFIEWFGKDIVKSESKQLFSIRDILSWANFINLNFKDRSELHNLFVHGGCVVFLDGLGSNSSMVSLSMTGQNQIYELRKKCLEKLGSDLIDPIELKRNFYRFAVEESEEDMEYAKQLIHDSSQEFGIGPFLVPKNTHSPSKNFFSIEAPTTFDNVRRVLRGLRIGRSIMLEGSPGVGKTSLIQALADMSGNKLVRINLSEQTDLIDLFGTDLPVEGGKGGEFCWRDAPFLQAMQNGWWVLLDEINLASQSVLEGLNSCLDHRGTVYLPELDKEFTKAPGFLMFAAQNPLQQGGGRKGLPKSFINRFTQVYIEPLLTKDLQIICKRSFPQIDSNLVDKVLQFNSQLHHLTMVENKFGKLGQPWEFNLRDVFRLLTLLTKDILCDKSSQHPLRPEYYLDVIYLQRMRSLEDRQALLDLFYSIFDKELENIIQPPVTYTLNNYSVKIGKSVLPKLSQSTTLISSSPCLLLQSQLQVIESMMKCVEMGWMSILIGPQACGKSSVVKWLGNITGNKLVEFSMNSGVDAMELLGGFEQMEPTRYRQKLSDLILDTLSQISNSIHHFANHTNSQQVLSNLKTMEQLKHQVHSLRTSDSFDFVIQSMTNFINLIITSMNLEKQIHLDTWLQPILSLYSQLQSLLNQSVSGRFEWVDGPLVTAMEQGHWLLIDNANLCHPSVLDRLNPLLETNGSLMVHERGLKANGEIYWVHPHPNFKIFLTMDPAYGELSRPMRNRGIEICFPSTSDWSLNWFDAFQIAQSKGIIDSNHIQTIFTVHHLVSNPNATKEPQPFQLIQGRSRDLSFLIQWVSERVQRGYSFDRALFESIQTVYKLTPSEINILISSEAMSQHELAIALRKPLSELMSYDSQLFVIRLQASYLIDLLANVPDMFDDEWLSKLSIGLSYFVEMATSSDIQLRILILNSLFENQPNLLDYVNPYLQYLGELTNNPLFNALSELYAQFSEQLDISPQLFASQPVYLPSNTSFYLSIDQRVKILNVESITAAWSGINQLCDQLRLVPQWYLLDELHHNIQTQCAQKITGWTLIEQSLRFELYQNFPSGQDPELINLFYPMLKSVLSLIQSAIFSPKFNSNFNHTQLNDLITLVRDFYGYVNELQLDYSKFGILVQKIAKTASHFEYISSYENVQKVTSSIFEFIDISSNKSMKLIWNRLHGLTSSDPQQKELLHSIGLKLQTIDYYNEISDSVNFTIPYLQRNEGIERTTLKALASLYIMNFEVENIQELKDLVQSSIDDYLSHVQNQKDEYSKSSKLTQDTDPVFVSAYSIFDYSSMTKESELITKIWESVTLQHQSLPNLRQTLESWLTKSLGLGSRPVSDFLGHQLMLWSLESASTSPQKVVPLVLEMLNSWFDRWWKVSFNHLLPTSYNNSPTSSELFGPTQVFQSLNTMSIFRMLNASQSLPLINLANYHKSTLQSLQSLSQRTSLPEDPYWLDLERIVYSMTQLVSCFEKYSNDKSIKFYQLVQMFKLIALKLASGEIKLQSDINNLKDTAQKMSNLVSGIQFTLFQTVCTPYVSQVIELLVTSIVEGAEFYKLHQGRIWVLIGLAYIELYIPKTAYDPVTKKQIQSHYLAKKKDIIGMEVTVRNVIENNINGSRSLLSEDLESTLEHITKLLDAILPNIIPRPPKSQILELCKDLNNLKSSLANSKHIISLLKMIEGSKITEAIEKERHLQDILNQFLIRTKSKYQSYSDILTPVVTAIYHLRHGVRLHLENYSLRDDSHSQILTALIDIVCSYPNSNIVSNKITFVDHIEADGLFEQVKDILTGKKSTSFIELYSNLLSIVLDHIVLDINRLGSINDSNLSQFNRYISYLSTVWSTVQEHRRQHQAEQDAFYQYKTQTVENFEETDEEIINKMQKELFPTFDSTYSGVNEEANDSKSQTSEVLFKEISDSFIAHIALIQNWVVKNYNKFETKHYSLNSKQSSKLALQTHHIVAQLFNLIPKIPSYQLDNNIYQSNLVALDILNRELAPSSDSIAQTFPFLNDAPYDFYHSSNLSESEKVLPILKDYKYRLEVLLEEHPEHAVLMELITITDRICSFPCHSPVAKYLTGLELLLQKSQLWEDYAHKGNNLSIQLAKITEQIVNWRKLEVKSWSGLLDNIELKYQQKAQSLWFDLYGMILAPILDSNSAPVLTEQFSKDLIDTLYNFGFGCNLGEFLSRVEMLESYGTHLDLLLSTQIESKDYINHIRGILVNMTNFFKEFVPSIRQRVTSERKPIEKELKDQAKISKFGHRQHVDAIKEAAFLTHKALAKQVKKYQTILSQPVKSYLDQLVINFDSVVSPVKTQKSKMELLRCSPTVYEVEDASDSETHKHILKRYQHILKQIFPQSESSNYEPFPLDAYIKENIEYVQECKRCQFPSDKDELKTKVKTEKMIRRKSLNDFWAEMKFIGLKYRSALNYPTSVKSSLELKPIKLFDSNWARVQINLDNTPDQSVFLDTTMVNKINRYYNLILSRIHHLQQLALQPNPDMTSIDVQRALGYVYETVRKLQSQRQSLESFDISLNTLFGNLICLKSLSSTTDYKFESDIQSKLIIHLHGLNLLGHSLVKGLTTLDISSKHSDNTSKAIELISKLKNVLSQVNSYQLDFETELTSKVPFMAMDYVNCNLLPNELINLINTQREKIIELGAQVQSITEEYANYNLILNSIQYEFQQFTNATFESQLPQISESSDITELDGKVQSIIESIQLSAQKLYKQSSQFYPDQCKDLDQFSFSSQHLIREYQYYQDIWANLNLSQLTQNIQDLISLFNGMIKTNTEESIGSIIKQTISRVMPFIHQYFLMLRTLIWKFLQFQKSFSKLSYFMCNMSITLLQNGFYLPNIDEEEGDGGEEDGVQGTGIGEGEGGKDVSEQIEDENQVTGTQNEQPQQPPPEGTNQEDNALDMNEDFDGELEDIDKGDQDQDDDEDSEDEDESQEMDKEMGDVDGEDDLLDDKVWGDDEPDINELDTNEDDKPNVGPEEAEMVAKEDEEKDEKKKNKPDDTMQVSDDEDEEREEKEDKDRDDMDLSDQENDQNDNDMDVDDPMDVSDDETQQNDKNQMDAEDQEEDMDLNLDDKMEMDDVDENDDNMDVDEDDKEMEIEDNQDQMDIDEDAPEDVPEEAQDDNQMEVEESQADNQKDDNDQEDSNQENQLEQDPDIAGEEPEEEEEKEGEEEEENEEENEESLFTQDQNPQAMQDENQDQQAETEEQTPSDNKNNNDTQGVKGESGQVNSDNQGNPFEQLESQSSASEAKPQPKSNPNENETDSMQAGASAQPNQGEPNAQEQEEQEKQTKEEINLNRKLAESLENFRKTLEVNDPKADEIEQSEDQQDAEAMPIDENAEQTYEYIQDDQEANEAQTVGAANEDQFKESLALPDDIDPETENEPTQQPPMNDQIVSHQAQLTDLLSDKKLTKPNANSTMVDNLESTENPSEIPRAALTEEEVQVYRQKIEDQIYQFTQTQEPSELREVWRHYDTVTHDLSLNLTEQLRLILEPTLATKLKGDYRTGKRLNMKKIIPYIASDFKKDKIWLRRTKPSKRQYQVMISVDDSKSMSDPHTIQLTFEALALVCKSLTQLEVGQVSVAKFGNGVDIIHPFSTPLTSESGANILEKFSFAQEQTNIVNLLKETLIAFQHARQTQTNSSSSDLWQLQIILSDAVCDDKKALEPYIRMAQENKIILLFIIIDNKEGNSITELTSIEYTTPTGSADAYTMSGIKFVPYLSTFPFQFYTVLRNVDHLPDVLSDALRQYFSIVSE